ncbi:MAG: hypothetical protein AAF693_13715 [Bacteroidota bacterium]
MIKYVICLLLTLPVWVSAQNPMDAATNVIPPSPEAASLGKFVDMPVNRYAGLPNINIPLYELKSYQLSLPISLSYHASGLKVEEIASSVGAGWALNAGGLVSRTIRGLNDEHAQGYFSTAKLNNVFEVPPFFDDTHPSGMDQNYIFANTGLNCAGTPGNPEDEYANIFFASRGGLDLEPDLFFFQLPDGQSGKFIYERDKSMKLIPKQYADISYTLDNNNNPFYTWEIIGRDGTHYYFDYWETTTTVNSCNAGQPIPHPESLQPEVPDVDAPSTWKLSKMVSANGLDSILFSYTSENLSYTQSVAVTEYDRITGTGGDVPGSACLNTTNILAIRLSGIEASNGYRVVFGSSSARQDLQGGHTLDSVKVYFNNDLVKYFTLDHSYNGAGTYYQKYLKLDRVTEFNSQHQALPSYDLTYHNGMFNFSRQSKNTDHWGYYNGASNTLLKAPGMIFQGRYYAGADREPDLISCRQGSLWKVRYPMGGETSFTYELHDFSNVPTSQQYPYTPGLEELAVIEFNITGDASIDYSDTKTFSLTEDTDVVYVYVIPEIFGGGIPISGNSGTLTKSGSSFQVDFTVSGPTNPQVETLSSGNYTLTAEFDPSQFSWPPQHPLDQQVFHIKILKVNDLDDLVADGKLKGGGLRVKTVKQNGLNEITKTFVYETAGGQSSGKAMSVPTYGYEMLVKDDTWSNPTCSPGSGSGNFLVRTSTSNVPLGLSQGTHVGYDRVIEYYGTPTQHNGYVVYTYTNTPDIQNLGGTSAYFPYVPNQSFAYKNGLLLSQETYTASGDLVAGKANTYTYTNQEEVGVGIKIAENNQTNCLYCPNREFVYNFYQHPTELVRLRSTESTSFDMDYEGYLVQTQTFSYNSFDQVEKVTTSTSEAGYWQVTEKDYHFIDHTREQEVREYFQVETAPFQYDYEFIRAQRTTFNANILPIEVRLAETDLQTLASNSPATFSPLFQKRLTLHAYGPTGNVLSYSKEGDVETSLVWGYDHLYPTAQAVYATENDIAYCSFEYGPPDGNWSYSGTGSPTTVSDAATGNKVFTGTGTFTRSGLNTGKSYKVAFWARGTGNVAINGVSYSVGSTPWKYIEATVTSVTSVTVTLSGQTVDELRLHPVGAQMTTYTYDPLTGMTSSTDPNLLTTTYTYDAFRRPEYTRDHEGNILNRNEYRYALDN